MALHIRDLAPLVNTSGSSVLTSGVGNLDDAFVITLFLSTGTNIVSSNVTIEVAMFDPGITYPVVGSPQSSAWYVLTSAVLSSGIGAYTINAVGFRGLRIRTSANSITTGTTLAYACKQIDV